MKIRFALALSLSLLATASSSALAAATAEEAARLKTVFESYLTNEPGVVTVTANAEDYAVKFDFKPLFGKIKDATIDITPIDFTLKPLETPGLWQFDQNGPVSFKLTSTPNIRIDATIARVMQSGVYSEKLNSFETVNAEMTGLLFKQQSTEPAQGTVDISYSVDKWTTVQTGEAGEGGTTNATSKSIISGLSEVIKSTGGSGGVAMDLTLGVETATYDTVSTGVVAKPILDLLAFFVAHPDKDLIVKDQAALKTILKSAIPVFANTTSETTAKNITATSPLFGNVAIASITSGTDMNGVVKNGKIGQKMTLSGVTLPDGSIPPWAKDLTPNNFTFDYAVSGFDLAGVADMVLADLDLSKDPPLPTGFENKILPAIMPTGALSFTINPTSVDSKAAAIQMEGVVNYGGGPLPTGSGVISATGFDEVMKAISNAPPEMGLQAGVAAMLLIKGLGKAEDGGKLSWKIESTPEGGVLVNGLDPMKMAPAQ